MPPRNLEETGASKKKTPGNLEETGASQNTKTCLPGAEDAARALKRLEVLNGHFGEMLEA